MTDSPFFAKYKINSGMLFYLMVTPVQLLCLLKKFGKKNNLKKHV